MLSSSTAVPSWAGPNEDGALIIHIAQDIVYSAGTPNCRLDLRDCAQAVTSIAPEPDDVVLLYLMLAFPYSRPEVRGITFGIDYTMSLLASGSCSDFELKDENWPAPGTGTALTWNRKIGDRLFPIYWFAVYAEYGTSFYIVDHPTQGAPAIADEEIPSNLDLVEMLGWAGFGVTGYNPCLEGVSTGACCLPDGSCVVTTENACRLQDGTYRGDEIACDAFACVGPCCLNNECYETTADGCDRDGAEWGERPGSPCGQISCLRENTTWGVLKYQHRDGF